MKLIIFFALISPLVLNACVPGGCPHSEYLSPLPTESTVMLDDLSVQDTNGVSYTDKVLQYMSFPSSSTKDEVTLWLRVPDNSFSISILPTISVGDELTLVAGDQSLASGTAKIHYSENSNSTYLTGSISIIAYSVLSTGGVGEYSRELYDFQLSISINTSSAEALTSVLNGQLSVSGTGYFEKSYCE